MDTLTQTLCRVISHGPPQDLGRNWSLAAWRRLVDTAQAHGVDGLLRRAFAAGGWPPAMPDEAREALRAHVYAGAGHNLRSYKALAAVVALAGDTPLVVLKGAALGPSLYPSPGLRPLTDVDLLAPAEAVDAIADAMAGLGFAPRARLAPELAREVDPHVALVGGPDGAVCVELHWGLLAGSGDWRAVPLEWFWRRTEPWRPPPAYLAAGGPPTAARQLDPTAALLYQCAHLVLQHGPFFTRLIWIYDLHLLVTRATVDWDAFVAQSHTLEWGEVARTALEQARACFGTPLDPTVLAALRGPRDPRVQFRGAGEPPAAPYTTWSSLAELRLPTRLRLLTRVVVPSRAYLRSAYEPHWGRWWPLAYPYRWLKPLRRMAARIARRAPL